MRNKPERVFLIESASFLQSPVDSTPMLLPPTGTHWHTNWHWASFQQQNLNLGYIIYNFNLELQELGHYEEEKADMLRC